MSRGAFANPNKRAVLLMLHGQCVGAAVFFETGDTKSFSESLRWAEEAFVQTAERLGFNPNSVSEISDAQALAILRDCKHCLEKVVQMSEMRLEPRST